MFDALRASVSGAALAALMVPTLTTTPLFASPGATPAEDSNLVLVQQFEMRSDTGSSNRIVAAAVIRTLSHEIPAAACHMHNGVSVEAAGEELEVSVANVDTMLDALLNGNETIGIIGPETRRTTIAEIEALQTFWAPVKAAAEATLADPSDAASVAFLYDTHEEFFHTSDRVLSEVKQAHSNPAELLQSDLLLIDVAARMSMMTQAMSYEACRVWSEGASAEHVEELESTKGTFVASLDALRNGMPALGILPPPNADIREALAGVAANWDEIEGYLGRVVANDQLTTEERADLYNLLLAKVRKVEQVEYLYSDFSKRVY